MSNDFIASYTSGVSSLLVGNPFDVIKVRLQAKPAVGAQSGSIASNFASLRALVRGTAAPILGYGGLNGILFVGYNRIMSLLGDSPSNPSHLMNVWTAGAVSGLACFVISAPTEVVKCRTQIVEAASSWTVARDIWRSAGIRGLYLGGAVTSLRDSVGYGFYFWTYEGVKGLIPLKSELLTTLVAGGIAGCGTWASIYPLDVIKTRVQTDPSLHILKPADGRHSDGANVKWKAWEHTKKAYQAGGLRIFFSGFWWCMGRAFIVNAVQWAMYEYIMYK